MSASQHTRKKLFLLGPYAALIEWVIQFTILTVLPVLMIGSMFAVIDLLTGGHLSHISDAFSLVWAIGQGAAIELLFFTSFLRIAQHARQGNYGKAIGWLLVGILLAIPSLQASVVYGMTSTFHLTISQAIGRLGISDMEWIVVRALAVIFVGALEGIAAYSSEGTEPSAEQIEREVERKARIVQANAKLTQARASAYVGAGKSIVRAVFNGRSSDAEENIDDRGSGGAAADPGQSTSRGAGSASPERAGVEGRPKGNSAASSTPRTSIPVVADDMRDQDPSQHSPLVVLSARSEARRRADAPRVRWEPPAEVERRVREALARDPTLSNAALARAADVSDSTASKYKRVLREERAHAATNGLAAT